MSALPEQPLAEDRLIQTWLARHSPDGEQVLIGPGDDAAMVHCPPDEELLITTDTLNEGVHFPPGCPARSIGHRALAASLSDLAAMAARPLWAVATLSVPSVDERWLEAFADGLYALANRFGVRVVGGDFVRGPRHVTVTAHGAARREAALRRNGASPGHGIWVSGFLGDAAAGLKLLENRLDRRRADVSEEEFLIRRFCYPRPRLELGRKLAGIASACMDLSDGLMQDLPRLLRGSGIGARLMAEQLPLSSQLKAVAGAEQARTLGLTGGDDYELCFAVPSRNERRLAQAAGDLPLTRVGELRAGARLAITFNGKPWRPARRGFTHFS